jgi:glyoxylase-like metal-dependent hydrolase (beta-lactamase superfamily II)
LPDPLVPIDLRFTGIERAIGVYLFDSIDGPILHDCGPATTLPRLREGLRERGVELSEIRHLLLSHIHLDHAGAAGPILRENPGLTVWVSEIGAPHLADPSRLEASARRLYGGLFDELWGELAPVPAANIRIASGNVLGWEAFPTPGHASHHVCYFREGTLLAGDAAGVRIEPSRHILPVSPPPDIDLAAWHESIRQIATRAPERLALIHFGVETGVTDHLARLGQELDRWAERVRGGLELDEFVAAGRADAGEDADLYDRVAPYSQSWHGLRRYWDKQAEAASAEKA